MCKNFSEIWNKRTSNTPYDQQRLYKCIDSIFHKTKPYFKLQGNILDRDDFFQNFYISKIMNALSHGRAIASPEKDDINVAYIRTMIERYYIDTVKQQKRDREEDAKIRADNLLIHGDSITPDESLKTHDGTNDKFRDAVHFIRSNEPWVLHILLNKAKGKKDNKLAGKVKAYQSKLAKLGVLLKGSNYTGARNITEYHQKTIIGRWLVETYPNEETPFSKEFLADIFKNLIDAALYIGTEQQNPSGDTNDI